MALGYSGRKDWKSWVNLIARQIKYSDEYIFDSFALACTLMLKRKSFEVDKFVKQTSSTNRQFWKPDKPDQWKSLKNGQTWWADKPSILVTK